MNKIQITNLIKSGAFDAVENRAREDIMYDYIDSISDKKQKLTLQNMQMLIDKKLIPEDMAFYGKLFLFNKFKGEIKMPKMKTKKSVAKRFSVTGTGKIKRAHDGKNHILTKKTRKRKRNLKKAAYVSKSYERNIKAMM
mgnify:CR=1 FL=1